MTTVMVVEDNDDLRRLICIHLASRGISVVEQPSAEAALRELRNGTDIDAVVIDVHLPGMDGFELVRQFRRERPHLPVLLASASSPAYLASQARQAGLHDVAMRDKDDLRGLVEAIAAMTAHRADVDEPPS